MTLTLEQMLKLKKERGYSYQYISEKSGVSMGTVQKVFGGLVKAPRCKTLQQLSKAFQDPAFSMESASASEEEPTRVPESYRVRSQRTDMLAESAAEYAGRKVGGKRQGEYTIDDYLQASEERRMELIDGILYDMSSPSTAHQVIVGALYAMFLQVVAKHEGGCLPLLSPLDVELGDDGKTILQPDVMILCDRSKLQEGKIKGAPDLVVEVISPSTKYKDMYVKLSKYAQSGIREYWIVDRQNETVIVYSFDVDKPVAIYGMNAKVPVGIWSGKAEIDFQKILNQLTELGL